MNYSEEAVDQMLKNQEVKLRLDGVELEVRGMRSSLEKHMGNEEREMNDLLKAIEDSGIERRDSEARVHKRITDNIAHNETTFVKKADLKLYAILIIAAVSITTGFITYVGALQNSNARNSSMSKVMEEMRAIIKPLGRGESHE